MSHKKCLDWNKFKKCVNVVKEKLYGKTQEAVHAIFPLRPHKKYFLYDNLYPDYEHMSNITKKNHLDFHSLFSLCDFVA